MNAWAMWAPTIVAILTAFFVAGKIAGRIGDQEKTLKQHNDRLDEHEDKLGAHAIAIAKSEAWRAGYEAGKGAHGR